MRIQPSILVDDDNTGQFCWRRGAGVGTGRPDEISFDASVTLRRRDGLVCRLDPFIGPGHPLAQSVVRHQGFDNRGRAQTAHRKSLHAVHEVAAVDLAMNKEVVQFYGFRWKLGSSWHHWRTPFQRIYHYARHVEVLERSTQPHPNAKRRAAQNSCMRAPLKFATRRPSRACATVTALGRLTAQRPFMPSSISRITSEGTPRTVEVIGATVTVARCPIALARVRIRTGRCLSGGANRHRRISPLLS